MANNNKQRVPVRSRRCNVHVRLAVACWEYLFLRYSHVAIFRCTPAMSSTTLSQEQIDSFERDGVRTDILRGLLILTSTPVLSITTHLRRGLQEHRPMVRRSQGSFQSSLS